MTDEYIERRILTGLIVSADYLSRVCPFWDSTFLEVPEIRKVADWCIDYYKKYGRAPKQDITSLFAENIATKKLTETEITYLEKVLEYVSDEYEREEQFNTAYLFDQTVKYFKGRKLERFNREIQTLIDAGKVEEAEKFAKSYEFSVIDQAASGLELPSAEALQRIDKAFDTTLHQVIKYPGALGEMWNDHLVRDGLVAFLAPEKRGKTFWLLELAMRALRQKVNVAFFEAGDMSEPQLLKRTCIYIARKSDRPHYCSEYYQPVGDCVYNQLNLCTLPERNGSYGIFEEYSEFDFLHLKNELLTYENLVEKVTANPAYSPCDSPTCPKRKGSIWLKLPPAVPPLTAEEAKKRLTAFFERYKRRLKLVCTPPDFLDVSTIKKYLDEWERYSGFVPDLIVIDYADLLAAPPYVREFRHKQDSIWKGLRALSEERHCLVVTATQSDAASYNRSHLTLSNFSEDKRKYAHVTAMFGLNQDVDGIEKKLSVMRINELVVREGEFFPTREVVVLYDFRIGRAFLESFWSS